MNRLATVLLLVVGANAALAHNGEYHPPLPPPKLEGSPRPGRAEVSPGPRDGETVTPGPDDVKPNDPLPRPPVVPRGSTAGFGRDDARFTVKLWWEANAWRYLPSPELPMREELISVLLDAVDAPSHTVRDRALIALGRAGGTRAFHRIRKACDAKNTELRVAGFIALGLLGDDSGSPILKKVVANAAAGLEARTFATLSLGLLGSKADAKFLREVLNEEWEPNIRSAAAIALGFLRDPGSVHALGRILHDAHPLASPDVSRLGDSSTRAGLAASAAWALGRILTPASYDYLVWAVDGGDPLIATSAALALAAAKGTVGRPSLYRALEPGTTISLRQQVLLGLGRAKDAKAVAVAATILASDAEREGLMGPFAALALGLAGEEKHTATLLGLVANRDAPSDLRGAAALALGLSAVRAAGPPLAKTLASEQRAAVLGPGVIALALLGHEAGTELAKKILEHSDLPEPRRDAVTALLLAKPEGVADLLATELADSYYVNRVAVTALARVDPNRATVELLKKLADDNLFARRFAAHSLGVLLARRRPGPFTELAGTMNHLSGAPVLKAVLYLENEYLFQLVRNF